MKRTRSIVLATIAVSTLVLAMSGTVSAEYDPWGTDPIIDDPPLWLYIEGSTYNPITSGDTWIAESWINPVEFSHGGIYTDYVDVIAHHKGNYAKNPYFFVWVTDDALISSITVGQAHLFLYGDDQGVCGDSALTTSVFVDSSTQTGGTLDTNPKHHQGQTGYWVRTQIGDVPRVPNFSFGNPVPELGESYFNPDNLTAYVRVPVIYTLTSDETKDLTALVIHYDAHNNEVESKLQSNTANSHDSSTYNVPEFTTIAIPIVALLGLVAFYRRKQKK